MRQRHGHGPDAGRVRGLRDDQGPLSRRRFLALAGGTAALAAGCSSVPPGRAGSHHVYTWKGTPYEIGVRHGRDLQKEIVAEAGGAVRHLARQRGTSEPKALDVYVSVFERCFREHTPSALEEIRGIARGSGLDYPYAFFAATRDGMRLPPEPAGECTSVYCGPATTFGAKVLIGQTKDTSSSLDRYRIQRLEYPGGRRAVILNYPGWIANLCMTSDGLCFTGNSLFAKGPGGPTVPFSLLKRLVLEKSSVDEVLPIARRHTFENAAMTIADARGRAVSWEGAAGRVTVRDISTEAYGHANSILCPSLKEHERPDQVVPCSSSRQTNVQAALDRKRGRIGIEDLTALFADHADFPTSICRHASDRLPGSTTAAFVTDLSARTIRIAIGNPCVAGFVEYGLDF